MRRVASEEGDKENAAPPRSSTHRRPQDRGETTEVRTVERKVN